MPILAHRSKPFPIHPDPWWVRLWDRAVKVWQASDVLQAIVIGIVLWVGSSLLVIGLLLVF
jgi:hypothetical protein